MKCVASCAFGIEAVLKREMQALGFDIVGSENGKIYFETDISGMITANMALRTADRVFLVLGQARATTFDHLFDFVSGLDLKAYLSAEGQYLIQAKSVKSALFSLRDVQAVTKKALIENLRKAYGINHFPESKERYRLLMNIQLDSAELWLDTSGDALHKRGYRAKQGEAPLKETLAAALVLLSFYTKDRVLFDPFCGSGTIAIEAAMIGKNVAPNLNRKFDFNDFSWVKESAIKTVRAKLLKAIDQDTVCRIIASDNDHKALDMAKENAFSAGVDDAIEFQLCAFEHRDFNEPYGIIVTNPPYGERMETLDDAEKLYKMIGSTYRTKHDYSLYMLTSYPGIEGIFGKKADRTRVLFNGNIKTRYYQFLGPRPK